MKTENKMAELLEEFRAQTEEAEACGGEAGIESIAGLAARESGTENIGSDEPAARAGASQRRKRRRSTRSGSSC